MVVTYSPPRKILSLFESNKSPVSSFVPVKQVTLIFTKGKKKSGVPLLQLGLEEERQEYVLEAETRFGDLVVWGPRLLCDFI